MKGYPMGAADDVHKALDDLKVASKKYAAEKLDLITKMIAASVGLPTDEFEFRYRQKRPQDEDLLK